MIVAALSIVSMARVRLSSDFLIVPGKSVGKIALGQSSKSLSKSVSPFDVRSSGSGSWACWMIDPGELDIYSVVEGSSEKIQEIRLSSSRYLTAKGFGPGVSAKRALQLFRKAKFVGSYPSHEVHTKTLIYDDLYLGMAFECLRGRCIAIIIHPSGERIGSETVPLTTYVPTLPVK